MTEADRISNLRRELAQRRGERDLLKRQSAEVRQAAESNEAEAAECAEARDLMAAVLAATQQMVVGFLEEIATLALRTVYGDDYALRLKVEVKRNQTEITPVLVFREMELSPRDEVGGGVVDVLSFGLRMALWAMRTPRSRPSVVLDEPFKYVSRDRVEAVGNMLKEVSGLLGVQLVLVTHDWELIACANRSWQVELKDGVSAVILRGG